MSDATKSFLDGTRTTYSQRVWDESGAGSGPYQPYTREQAIQSSAAVTASDVTPVTAGRQFAILCTTLGNVKVKFADGSTFTFPVETGLTLLPWAVIQVFVTGTTAVATYANLT